MFGTPLRVTLRNSTNPYLKPNKSQICGNLFYTKAWKERNKTSEITKSTRSFSNTLRKEKVQVSVFGQWNKVAGSGRVF